MTKRRKQADKSGAILGVIMVMLVVLSLMGMGLLKLSAHHGIETARAISEAQAFWAAEAGLEEARALARAYVLPFDQIEAGLDGAGAHSGTTVNGTYTVDIVEAPGYINTLNRIKRYLITSTGTSGGATHSVSMIAETETFATYLYASHFEHTTGGYHIPFWHTSVIDGPVYVNDVMRIWGDPQILGPARSASNLVDYVGTGGPGSFQGGLELNVEPLEFAKYDHVGNIRKRAEEPDGHVFDGDVQITFLPIAVFVVMAWDNINDVGIAPMKFYSMDPVSFNGAIYVSGDAHVNGVVDGNVTLAAGNDILIRGDIVYKSASAWGGNPGPFDSGFDASLVTDRLGLIAQRRVQVQTTQTTAIHAAILVVGDYTESEFVSGFSCQYHGNAVYDPPLYLLQASLNMWGSISQYRRGATGWWGLGENVGFRDNYKYDTRFITHPPPFFPYSTYAFSQWQD